ncbi:MAG: PH domain-containing protein [Muribaculaceae bacterium]|nr:PH domain-containing protein [Muribaculaceae bacterium]
MMTDLFSRPQRMSPAALVIIYAKLFKRSVGPLSFPAFYSLFTSSSEDRVFIILMIIGVCLFVPFILALLSYFPKKFYIKDGNLIFIYGLINRENTIVPLDRVHSLRTEKGIWFRLLDMRGIIFDTLATRQEEIELILDEYDWKRLLAVIEKEERPLPQSESEPPEYNPTATIHFPTKNLLLAALCQNHLKGMAVLLSLSAVIFGSFEDLSKEQYESILEWMVSFLEMLVASPLRIVASLVIVYAVILVMWLGKTLLRYYDTTMNHDKQLLTFTYGMLTRSSCRFFYDKICTIWVKRNFLEKKFGFCTLMLRQALNVTAQKEEENMKLYGTDSSSFFLKWWLGEGYASAEDVISAKSGKGVFYRHIAIPTVIALAVCLLLYYSQLYIWILFPLLYMLILIPRGICTMRHSSIVLKPEYLIVHNGAFAGIDNYIKYTDIEVVQIRRSPFTRRFHRVSLAISTSGTTFVIRSLKEKEASLIRELLLKAEE